jgi:hypothetical protein
MCICYATKHGSINPFLLHCVVEHDGEINSTFDHLDFLIIKMALWQTCVKTESTII